MPATPLRRRLRPALPLLALLLLATLAPASRAEAPARGRILIVATSHAVLGYTGYPTGAWISEITHPYFLFLEAGYEVDVASVQGGAVPIDPYSDPLNAKGINGRDLISRGFLSVPEHKAKLLASLKLAEVKVDGYAAVVFAGGNGALFDFPSSAEVTRVAQQAYDGGRVLATLCHGAAALLNLKAGDQPLVKGRPVTGFTNEEEALAQAQIVGKDGKPYVPLLLEDELVKRGAVWKESGPFRPFAVADGRLVTGQQNLSGLETARLVLQVLETPAK